MNKISAVYKITNTITGDFYIGSSKDVKMRWADHKKPSTWKNRPNSPMYQDMQKYGADKFIFQILCPVMPEYLKQVEQELIEMIHPTYNNIMAKGRDAERYKEVTIKWRKSDKGKESVKKWTRKYLSQLCFYNGEILKLGALRCRFKKQGIEHPFVEAKKYLLTQ